MNGLELRTRVPPTTPTANFTTTASSKPDFSLSETPFIRAPKRRPPCTSISNYLLWNSPHWSLGHNRYAFTLGPRQQSTPLTCKSAQVTASVFATYTAMVVSTSALLKEDLPTFRATSSATPTTFRGCCSPSNAISGTPSVRRSAIARRALLKSAPPNEVPNPPASSSANSSTPVQVP